MFRETIQSTELTTEFANDYFRQKIDGNAFQRDLTFLTTLRALVAPRMKNDEVIFLDFASENAYSDRTEERIIVDATAGMQDYRNRIFVKSYNGAKETLEKYMHTIESKFESQYSGWHRIAKVTDFYRKVFNVQCFANNELKSVIILTAEMDMRRMHYLQCGIPAFLPWYFDPKVGISDLEMELICSPREKTPDKYQEAVAKIAAQYDFRSSAIRQMLDGFESRYERIQMDNYRNRIERYTAKIVDLNNQIGQFMTEKRDCENTLLGLELKVAQTGEDSEIMQYFLGNKRLTLASVNDSTMVFYVKDYLSYFDEELADRMINDYRSVFYKPDGRSHESVFSAEDMKMLMTEVFLNQTIKIKFCAAYEFALNGNVHAVGGYSYGSACNDSMPNTHIDRYRCLGGYEQRINEFLSEHDYIGAIEQCVASCKSLNFGDSTVMREFMCRIYKISDYSVNIRCFELPDGRVVTPKEAIAYLNEKKAEENANG